MNFFEIGKDKPYLVAEIGINHNADLEIVSRLIDAAVACGWDCVKFQKRNPDVCVPEEQKKVMRETPWGRMTYLEYKHRLEFGLDEYKKIDEMCQGRIDWTVSVWDISSLYFMKLNFNHVPFIKIPSALMTNYKLIGKTIDAGFPVLVSTGMSTQEEVDTTYDFLLSKTDIKKFALMHCNSSYPANPNELNLACIPQYKKRYCCAVGYSGHEFGIVGSTTAAAFGARIIERHVTLDRNMWGTDQSSSVEIVGMAKLRKHVDEVVEMVGDGTKRLYDSELLSRKKLRGN